MEGGGIEGGMEGRRTEGTKGRTREERYAHEESRRKEERGAFTGPILRLRPGGGHCLPRLPLAHLPRHHRPPTRTHAAVCRLPISLSLSLALSLSLSHTHTHSHTPRVSLFLSRASDRVSKLPLSSLPPFSSCVLPPPLSSSLSPSLSPFPQSPFPPLHPHSLSLFLFPLVPVHVSSSFYYLSLCLFISLCRYQSFWTFLFLSKMSSSLYLTQAHILHRIYASLMTSGLPFHYILSSLLSQPHVPFSLLRLSASPPSGCCGSLAASPPSGRSSPPSASPSSQARSPPCPRAGRLCEEGRGGNVCPCESSIGFFRILLLLSDSVACYGFFHSMAPFTTRRLKERVSLCKICPPACMNLFM
jgi:hypothetical protein